MDSGLLAGIAEGLKSGVGSYYQAKEANRAEQKDARDAARQRLLDKLALKEKGLQVKSGSEEDLEYTPEYQTEKKFKTAKEALNLPKGYGLIPDETSPYGYKPQKLEGYHDYNEEAEKARAEVYKAQAGLLGAKTKTELAPPAPPTEAERFKELPEENKIQIKKHAEKIANVNAVKDGIDSILPLLTDPKVPKEQKIVAGQNLAKLLNSPEGADAVGEGETKRIMPFLDYYPNTTKGLMLGPDIDAFVKQLQNTRNFLDERSSKSRQAIDSLQGRKSKDQGLVGKTVKVSNGKETYLVPKEKVQEAAMDGFEVIE